MSILGYRSSIFIAQLSHRFFIYLFIYFIYLFILFIYTLFIHYLYIIFSHCSLQMSCKEWTDETYCTFKCCISGLHAVRMIIQGLGCVFQIIGFEVARYVALCLLTFFPSLGTSASQPEKLRKQSSLQTHMNEKWVLQNTIGLTDTRTKRSFVQFVQACRTSSFNY